MTNNDKFRPRLNMRLLDSIRWKPAKSLLYNHTHGMRAREIFETYRNPESGRIFAVPVGGKRAGAGRKPGAAWAPKRPRDLRDMAKSRVREVLTTANDPLAVLVEIANDHEVDVQIRVQAAIGAAPFMFPRLSASVVATAPATARDDTAGLVDRLMQRFARLAPPVQTIDAEPACANAE